MRTSIGGRSWYEYRVLEIGSVDRDAADFSKPRIEHRALSTGVAGEDPIDLQQARTLLGRAAFWAGKEVAGRKLALVRRQEVRVGFGRDSGVPPRTGVALELVYGQVQNGHGSGDFVAISEATDPEYVWAWPQTPWVRQVPEGSLRFNLFGAFLQRDGVYVQILHFPPSEEVALAVARALRPIGSG